MLKCFVASGMERGETRAGWDDTERNEILMLLRVTMSKDRKIVWPGKRHEDSDIHAALEVGWVRSARAKNLKQISVIH